MIAPKPPAPDADLIALVQSNVLVPLTIFKPSPTIDRVPNGSASQSRRGVPTEPRGHISGSRSALPYSKSVKRHL